MALSKHVQPFLLVGASIKIIDELVDDNVLLYTPGNTYATGDIIRRTDNDEYYTVIVDGVLDDTNFDTNTERFILTDISSGGYFTQLRDTPSAYGGHANKMVTVKSDESGLEFITQPAEKEYSLLDLTDTPSDYTGKANNIVVVKSSEDGVDFVEFDPSTGVISVNGYTGVVVLNAADVGAHPNTWTPTWDQVSGKPTEFPPSAHDHNSTYYTKDEIDTMLANYSEIGHTHTEIPNDLTVTGNLTINGTATATGDITAFFGTIVKKIKGLVS
jgi:hypothetical protein